LIAPAASPFTNVFRVRTKRINGGMLHHTAHLSAVTREDVQAVLQRMSMVRAGLNAFAARDASVGEIADFGTESSPFRVVAPETTHQASLEKNSGADARAIVDRETLDNRDNIRCVHHWAIITKVLLRLETFRDFHLNLLLLFELPIAHRHRVRSGTDEKLPFSTVLGQEILAHF